MFAAAWMLALAAHAAPVAAIDGGAAADNDAKAQNEVGSQYTLDGASKPMPGDRSKTVDLLIDMQSKNAGLDFNERTRLRERTALTSAAQPQPQPQVTSHPSGLFGTTVNPGEAARERRREDGEWQSAPLRGRNASHLSMSSPGDGSGQDDIATAVSLRRWPAIQAAIRFVRENRELVAAGAVATLALVWGASIAMSQRRR